MQGVCGGFEIRSGVSSDRMLLPTMIIHKRTQRNKNQYRSTNTYRQPDSNQVHTANDPPDKRTVIDRIDHGRRRHRRHNNDDRRCGRSKPGSSRNTSKPLRTPILLTILANRATRRPRRTATECPITTTPRTPAIHIDAVEGRGTPCSGAGAGTTDVTVGHTFCSEGGTLLEAEC